MSGTSVRLVTIERRHIERSFVTKGSNMLCEIRGSANKLLIKRGVYNKIQNDAVVEGVISISDFAADINVFKTLQF